MKNIIFTPYTGINNYTEISRDLHMVYENRDTQKFNKRQEKLHNIISSMGLVKVKMNDEKNYPHYYDGTAYYKNAKGKIYRVTLDGIYEALGNAQFKEITNTSSNTSKCVPSGMCHSWSLLGCPK